MQSRFYAALAAALFAASAPASVHEYRLANGMLLLVKEDRRAPVVVAQIWYKVGGSYEHDGLTGISHALEHMMFKGTTRHPAGQFSAIIAQNGGRENAFTGADYTAYFQTLERSRLEVSLELEADRMGNLTLPGDEFDKEIRVVREERRLRVDDQPEAFTDEVAAATAYQTSPYRQPIIGWMADLETLDVQRMRDWYSRWYVPANATLVVAGDVRPDEVRALAEKHFGMLAPGTVAPPAPRPEVLQPGLKRVIVKRPAEVPYLLMSWKVPSLPSALRDNGGAGEFEPYALEVLAGLLDGGNSARFRSRLVRGREVAASVGTGYNLIARLDTLFSIDGTPASGHDVAALERAIRDEIEELRRVPVEPRELERVKAQVVSEDVYQRDSAFYQALVLGMLEAVGLPWTLADRYVERINAVTAEQVQQVANRYFIDDRLTVAMLEPQPLDPDRAPPAPREEGGHVH
jgi:zinc protease